jgi:L-proline amide hydrolase
LGKLLKQFPIDIQTTLLKNEADGTIDSPEYQEAKLLFYGQVLCRTRPFPDVLMASIQASQEDTTVNDTMYAHCPAPMVSSLFFFSLYYLNIY